MWSPAFVALETHIQCKMKHCNVTAAISHLLRAHASYILREQGTSVAPTCPKAWCQSLRGTGCFSTRLVMQNTPSRDFTTILSHVYLFSKTYVGIYGKFRL